MRRAERCSIGDGCRRCPGDRGRNRADRHCRRCTRSAVVDYGAGRIRRVGRCKRVAAQCQQSGGDIDRGTAAAQSRGVRGEAARAGQNHRAGWCQVVASRTHRHRHSQPLHRGDAGRGGRYRHRRRRSWKLVLPKVVQFAIPSARIETPATEEPEVASAISPVNGGIPTPWRVSGGGDAERAVNTRLAAIGANCTASTYPGPFLRGGIKLPKVI